MPTGIDFKTPEEGGKMVLSLLTSHDPNYVHHFYSLFEQLWDNGIDAADRIEDIEGGIEFADIETPKQQ
jgi:two-component system, OmpR family, sensor histidine kinase VicK